MLLITSAAFISADIQAELGTLPPAFLPLGNKKLFEHQARALQQCFPDDNIYLSVTDAFELRRTDRVLLAAMGVELIVIPEGLSLGYSVLHAINSVGIYHAPLRILHGDTLIDEIPADDECVAVGESFDEYSWTTIGQTEKVWAGYFSFTDVSSLARSITGKRGNFVEAVREYIERHRVEFPQVETWHDFGHANTYFRSRAAVTTQRAFNQLTISDGVVTKRSAAKEKMLAEANWFKTVPMEIQLHTPRLLDMTLQPNYAEYKLEYLPCMPLNELYVHGHLSEKFWRKIFHRAGALLAKFQAAGGLDEKTRAKVADDYRHLIDSKTDERIEAHFGHPLDALKDNFILNGIRLPPLKEIIEECKREALSGSPITGVSHGDFCFSNILYDSRLDILKVVDPRGINASGEQTIFGDLRYDISKLSHSIIGYYDHIVAGLFTLNEDRHASAVTINFQIYVDASVEKVAENFLNLSFVRSERDRVFAGVILLFLSMLPLHADRPDRQRAFFANALRIYTLWKGLD